MKTLNHPNIGKWPGQFINVALFVCVTCLFPVGFSKATLSQTAVLLFGGKSTGSVYRICLT